MPTLNWMGKEKIVNHHQNVKCRVLKKQYTYNSNESNNMIIHGDNLLALKTLLIKYEEKIDIVYGGSVDVKNCSTFAKIKGINGLLVGGASLNVDNFAQITKI